MQSLIARLAEGHGLGIGGGSGGIILRPRAQHILDGIISQHRSRQAFGVGECGLGIKVRPAREQPVGHRLLHLLRLVLGRPGQTLWQIGTDQPVRDFIEREVAAVRRLVERALHGGRKFGEAQLAIVLRH